MNPLKNRVLSRIIICIIILLVAVMPSITALAVDLDPEQFDVAACAVMDADTGTLLFSKNYTEKIYPASTTKIMTALLVIENCKLDDVVTVGDEISNVTENESQMYLSVGEEITVRDLLYGLMLVSGNDAARVLAVHTGGSIEEFCDLMNKRCKELGMTNTQFNSPHGLQSEDHFTTAEDMLKLTLAAMQSEELMTIVGTKSYTTPANNKSDGHSLVNSNRLLTVCATPEKQEEEKAYLYEYATGMKTGATTAAKSCLVATAKKDGRSLAAVIFGEPTGTGKWDYAKKLFDYGYTAYVNMDISDMLADQSTETTVLNCADFEDTTLVCKPDLSEAGVATLSTDVSTAELDIAAVPSLNPNLTAPVKEGDVVGTVQYRLDDKVIYEGNLLATRDVYEFGAEPTPSPGPVSSIPTVDIDDNAAKTDSVSRLMWWWLVIPGGLIAFLVVKTIVGRSRRRRYRSRSRRRRR